MERGERLLNLKDFLTVLQPSLNRVFNNGPILRPPFWCKIVPNSAISCQNVPEYGIKLTFFTADSIENASGPWGSGPNERGAQISRQAESITRAPHAYLPSCGHRISRAGRWLVTDMVQQRKLTEGPERHFPHPFCHFGEKSLLQTRGLLGLLSDFGRFWGYQILPNFTNFYQKRAANGPEEALKGT